MRTCNRPVVRYFHGTPDGGPRHGTMESGYGTMEATYVAALDDAQEYDAGRTMVRDTDPSIGSTRWVAGAGWDRALSRRAADTVLIDRIRAGQWADQCWEALNDTSDGAARDDVKGDTGTIDMRAARGDSTTGIETNYDPIDPALASIGAHNPDGTSAPMGSATFWQAAQDGLSSMRGPRRSIGQFTHQIWRTWEAPQDVRVYHECASGERVLVRTFTPSPVELSADIRAYRRRAARVARKGTRAAQVWAALSSEYRHKRIAIRRVKWAASVTVESCASEAARKRAARAANPIVRTPESRAANAARMRAARAAKVAKVNAAQSYY